MCLSMPTRTPVLPQTLQMHVWGCLVGVFGPHHFRAWGANGSQESHGCHEVAYSKNENSSSFFLWVNRVLPPFYTRTATIDAPLTDLLQKDVFKWGDRELTTFNSLKQHLSSAPILCLPDINDTSVIEANVLSEGIRAVLLHKRDPFITLVENWVQECVCLQ